MVSSSFSLNVSLEFLMTTKNSACSKISSLLETTPDWFAYTPNKPPLGQVLDSAVWNWMLGNTHKVANLFAYIEIPHLPIEDNSQGWSSNTATNFVALNIRESHFICRRHHYLNFSQIPFTKCVRVIIHQKLSLFATEILFKPGLTGLTAGLNGQSKISLSWIMPSEEIMIREFV